MATLYTSVGEKKSTITLAKEVFKVEMAEGLVHRLFLLQRNNARAPIAHTKTRGERSGSTRKIYRQKGTGRARMGSNRSPIRRKGGVVFGPRSNRNFTEQMNRKERRLALTGLLSSKTKSTVVFESLEHTKTQDLQAALSKVCKGTTLVAVGSQERAILTVGKNLKDVKVIFATYINPADVLKYTTIAFTKQGLTELTSIHKNG